MNNKGQTLVTFVVLIPLIVLIMALVIDNGLIISEKNKLESSTKTIIKSIYPKINDESNYEEMVIELYEKNNIKYQDLIIKYENKRLNILIKKEVNSIFGRVIGQEKYELEIGLTGYLLNDKIMIEKGIVDGK